MAGQGRGPDAHLFVVVQRLSCEFVSIGVEVRGVQLQIDERDGVFFVGHACRGLNGLRHKLDLHRDVGGV